MSAFFKRMTVRKKLLSLLSSLLQIKRLLQFPAEQTTKDIATSPLKSPESLSKHRSTSAVPKTPTAR